MVPPVSVKFKAIITYSGLNAQTSVLVPDADQLKSDVLTGLAADPNASQLPTPTVIVEQF